MRKKESETMKVLIMFLIRNDACHLSVFYLLDLNAITNLSYFSDVSVSFYPQDKKVVITTNIVSVEYSS